MNEIIYVVVVAAMTAIMADPILVKVLAYTAMIFIFIYLFNLKSVRRVSKGISYAIQYLIKKHNQVFHSRNDKKMEKHPITTGIDRTFLYLSSVIMFTYGAIVIFLSTADEVLWYKKIIALLVGLIVIYCSGIAKAQGDNE